MRRFEALIFDLGSTLIYFDGNWSKIYSQANAELLRYLKAAGLNLDGEAFLKEFSARLEKYYAEREAEFIEYTTAYNLRALLAEWGYPEVPDAVIEPALEAMYSISQAYWKPEADAAPTLKKLREQDYLLGLISNAADDADVQALVDKANLRPYFEIILSSAAVGIRKPHPRIFEMALEALEATPSSVAMVGDTLGADILGAQNSGIFSIWITRRADVPANRAHSDTINPDATVGSLREIPDLLEDLAKK
jgi:putative hydrolase of the HAD superfamily